MRSPDGFDEALTYAVPLSLRFFGAVRGLSASALSVFHAGRMERQSVVDTLKALFWFSYYKRNVLLQRCIVTHRSKTPSSLLRHCS